MSDAGLGLLSFLLLLASSAAGWGAAFHFPQAFSRPSAREAVRRIVGIVALLAAIMLGFGIAAQEATFADAQRQVNRLAHEITSLDAALARLGPQSPLPRRLLFRLAVAVMSDDFPGLELPPVGEADDADTLQDALEAEIERLAGAGPPPRPIIETLAQLHEVAQTRWEMDSHLDTSVQGWQVAALIVWSMLAFAGMGTLVPRNRAMALVLALGAAAMAGAVFLLIEFSDPFRGVIVVSGEPLVAALHTLADR